VVAHIIHDDHSDPSLLVEPDQRLTVFWSGHNGAQLDYRTTVRAGDITAWTSVVQIRQRIRGTDGFTSPTRFSSPPSAIGCTCSGEEPTGVRTSSPVSPTVGGGTAYRTTIAFLK
jgi:hypothetical protein